MAKKLSFEEGLQELESIAMSLESGEIGLEESFKAYEKAVKLKNELYKILDAGDKKIRVLTEQGETEIREEDEL